MAVTAAVEWTVAGFLGVAAGFGIFFLLHGPVAGIPFIGEPFFPAELGFFVVHGHPASISGQIQAFASSFLLIIVGLVIAGPWLTMAAARVMARWTSRPDALIAARRLSYDPRAAFRAVSGLVLALFITTAAVVAITAQDAKNLTRWGSAAAAGVLTDQLSDQPFGSASQG